MPQIPSPGLIKPFVDLLDIFLDDYLSEIHCHISDLLVRTGEPIFPEVWKFYQCDKDNAEFCRTLLDILATLGIRNEQIKEALKYHRRMVNAVSPILSEFNQIHPTIVEGNAAADHHDFFFS